MMRMKNRTTYPPARRRKRFLGTLRSPRGRGDNSSDFAKSVRTWRASRISLRSVVIAPARRRKRLGLVLLGGLVLFAAVGPLLSPFSLARTDLANAYLPPLTGGHLMGTDLAGRDVLTLLMSALGVSLTVALCAVMVQMLLGVLLGLASGCLGRAVDRCIMAAVDTVLSLPTLLVLLMTSALLGKLALGAFARTGLVAVVIGLLSWPACARLVRGETLRLREQGFVTAAAAGGVAPGRILTCYLLPNLLPQVAVTATLGIGDAIIAESVLSFLGLGVSPPLVSLGGMIRSMTRLADLRSRPWLWLGAGILVILCVSAFHLIGAGREEGKRC